nr:Uncharacterised protein [Salmonella sp. NCTC 7297]
MKRSLIAAAVLSAVFMKALGFLLLILTRVN